MGEPKVFMNPVVRLDNWLWQKIADFAVWFFEGTHHN
jgi:hypothetical protein